MKKRVLSLFMLWRSASPCRQRRRWQQRTPPSRATQLTEPTPVPQEPETPDQGENTEPSAAEKAAPVGEVSETADSTHKHYLCGGDTCNKVGHDENTKTTFTAWTDTLAQTQYGNTNVKTPNLDRFARQGFLFENAYSEGLPTIPVRRRL